MRNPCIFQKTACCTETIGTQGFSKKQPVVQKPPCTRAFSKTSPGEARKHAFLRPSGFGGKRVAQDFFLGVFLLRLDAPPPSRLLAFFFSVFVFLLLLLPPTSILGFSGFRSEVSGLGFRDFRSEV